MIIIMEMDKVMNLSIRLNVHICVLISFSASATGHWLDGSQIDVVLFPTSKDGFCEQQQVVGVILFEFEIRF